MLDFQDILNSVPELIYTYDACTYELIYMNKPAMRLLGNCVGMKLDKALSEKLLLSGDTSVPQGENDRIYNGADGRVYVARTSHAESDGREIIIETVTDISFEALQKKELEARLEREHIIMSCIIELHKNKPFNETVEYILSMTCKFLEAERVYIYKYDNGIMTKSHSYCAEGMDETVSVNERLDPCLTESWVRAFNNYESIIIDDIEAIKDRLPEGYNFLSKMGIHHIVIVPIHTNGNLVGFIGVDNLPTEKMGAGHTFFTALSEFISIVLIRESTESKLRKMSYTDTLTNIYNRNKFIADCSEMTRRRETNVGVVYMDLNGLKEINDKKGHTAGDNALRHIAKIIIDVFDGDEMYRVGGDEFVVFCRGIDESAFNTKVNEFMDTLEKSEYKVAVGYKYAANGSDINDIIRDADEDMYRDKKYFYRNSGQSRRYRVRNDNFAAISTPERIKKLISEERFLIWFQPRFTTDTEEFAGSEALIRFFSEDDLVISPLDFIPEMEDNDTIYLLDFYVFRHVCEYISGWINSGRNVKPVSINMSHATLRKPNLIENIMEIWYDYRVPKELIVIEVSEDQENGGISDVSDVLAELKKCGFRLAIDNFGSKYADLYLFADIKFDILKLDGDMVYKIETDKKTRLLSTSIMQICHNEDIKIVAAGVENEKELKALLEIGCDEVQGYLFDKPMSWNKFEEKYL